MLLVWGVLFVVLMIPERVAWHQAVIFGSGYAFSMILMSPDLDLARSDAFRRWGALRWIWYPYAWVFRHRQVSHHLLIGPLTRILYLLALIAAGMGAYVLVMGRSWPQAWLSEKVALALLLGLYMPNLQHVLADRIVTVWRRKRRRNRL